MNMEREDFLELAQQQIAQLHEEMARFEDRMARFTSEEPDLSPKAQANRIRVAWLYRHTAGFLESHFPIGSVQDFLGRQAMVVSVVAPFNGIGRSPQEEGVEFLTASPEGGVQRTRIPVEAALNLVWQRHGMEPLP